ncbi:DEAD/DEAH box helicase [Pasteurella multocida]|uniref:DEAD/DEAH box helicase n=1 Tax=Pasteurella multocida TaxID=747 RepID=UPI0020236BA9|nr:DEAD/DEAH box helicase [Pasteurella multocida]URH94607.1 DEAD/DEAH box helicase [Pasteurella multocida]URI00995.1 DEAD/DEAH box helicase [Pasteurella multocida]HEA3250353.1 DEAD/DEAH box helicase [Pasteurella multocida]
MKLREYQQSIFKQLISSCTNDLVQLDTGAGKTPIIAKLAEHYKQVVIVCHRNVLVKQASEKLAAFGLKHRIMASNATKRICATNNVNKHGAHYISPRSHLVLVSIDTWNSHFKREKLHFDFSKEYIILIDEAHHFAEDNKWETMLQTVGGRCIGFTATPIRNDGLPLIKKFNGFFDRIVQAEGYQQYGTERLIAEGYLAEYKAYIAMAGANYDIPLDELVQKQLKLDHKESINFLLEKKLDFMSFAMKLDKTFDDYKEKEKELYVAMSPLGAYLHYGKGGQAIVIVPRIMNANEEVNIMQKHGVSAEVIHSELPQYEIQRILDFFENKKIKVLIAVDMISEGFDVPDADILILKRKIRSFGLYRQVCGRVLRPRQGKLAKIIDLTGYNIAKHGLPSDPVNWESVEEKAKMRKQLVFCENCGHVYSMKLNCCPECGTKTPELANSKIPFIKSYFYDAKLIEKHRKELRIVEKQRIEQEKKAEKERLFNETYQDVYVSFPQTLVGNKTKEFFNTFCEQLKTMLKCKEYNEFMKKYEYKLNEFNFYLPHFLQYAQSNKKADAQSAVKKIYEEKTGVSL